MPDAPAPKKVQTPTLLSTLGPDGHPKGDAITLAVTEHVVCDRPGSNRLPHVCAGAALFKMQDFELATADDMLGNPSIFSLGALAHNCKLHKESIPYC